MNNCQMDYIIYSDGNKKGGWYMYTTMNIISASKGKQVHNHEFLGSTQFAEKGKERHNHRFAGVTGEAIPIGKGNHIHEFRTNTDFTGNHYHVLKGKTGPEIELPDGHHIHYVDTVTSFDDGHKHKAEFATLTVPRG